jgi:hypothetical protein
MDQRGEVVLVVSMALRGREPEQPLGLHVDRRYALRLA